MITLRLRAPDRGLIDVSSLQPGVIGALTEDQLARHPLPSSRGAVRVDEIFAISGRPETGRLRLKGVAPSLQGLGRGLASGLLLLEGDCGDWTGAGMRGGEISITGSARDRLGAGMRGGLLRLRGNAGDFTGGSLPGAVSGMRGGSILINGDAGARLGDRLRRGLIVVTGDTGLAPASQMIAGTLVVLGRPGAGLGSGMRRGSVLVRTVGPRLPPTFVDSGTHELSFITLLARHLESLDPGLVPALRSFRHVRRLVGDRGCAGQGEILLAER